MAHLAEYQSEIGFRNKYTVAPEVIEFQPTKPTRIHNFPGGGIWVVVAKPGSKILPELRGAVSNGDYNRLGELINSVNKAFYRPPRNKRGFKSIHDIPVLAELTYGPKTIAQGLFLLPETEALRSFVPYNGGELSAHGFKLSQYFWIGSEVRIDSLILIRKPTLTLLEKTIFQKVPSDVSEANLGTAADPAFAGAYPAAVATAVATWLVGKVLDAVVDWVRGDNGGGRGRHRATYRHGRVAASW